MESLKGKKILVTGAGGFIGSHVVEALLREGATVVGFDNKPACDSSIPAHIILEDKNFEYVWGDITDVGEVTAVFAKNNFDMVCHQAALISVPMSFIRPDEYFETNVRGTQIIFDTARRCGVKKIVLASSCAVYDSASPYAFNKTMCEQIAVMYRNLYKMNIITLRYFNVYGPRQVAGTEGAVIPALIKAIKNNNPVIHGDGKQTRDFVFVRDVAAANVQALKYEGTEVHIFEVGNGEETSINELYDYLCVAMGGGVEPTHTPARAGDVNRSCAYAACTTKGLLCWEPQFNMTKGLAITCFAYGKDSDE
jgi:UDP-glucose 4-epimerase